VKLRVCAGSEANRTKQHLTARRNISTLGVLR